MREFNDGSKIDIYTDGSCLGNPGKGGWGAALLCGQRKKEISGAKEQTTNNKMVLTNGLKAGKRMAGKLLRKNR